jgi:hypothetical protein
MADRTSNIISVIAVIVMLVISLITISSQPAAKLEDRVIKVEDRCGKNETDIAVSKEQNKTTNEKLDEIKALLKSLMEKK